MQHLSCRITTATIAGPSTLALSFNDGTHQTIDLSPVLRGGLYRKLRNPRYFAKVALDPDSGTVVWPNGADFDPALRHDWPTLAAKFTKLAQAWPP
ncbi:MAG: DUF2442 domain-containing protein [Myxococcales bacterium]|nr:DUF2442 domain-containing protein [Myxococcales bacterium]